MKSVREQSTNARPTLARLVIYGVALGGALLVLYVTLAPFYFTHGAFVFVLLLSLGLSLTVEVLQVFQPWRSPSLTDLLMNSIGGILGFLGFRAGGQALMRFISTLTGKKRPYPSSRR